MQSLKMTRATFALAACAVLLAQAAHARSLTMAHAKNAPSIRLDSVGTNHGLLGNKIDTYAAPGKTFVDYIWDLSLPSVTIDMKVIEDDKGKLFGCAFQVESGPVRAIPDELVQQPTFQLVLPTEDVPQSSYPHKKGVMEVVWVEITCDPACVPYYPPGSATMLHLGVLAMLHVPKAQIKESST